MVDDNRDVATGRNSVATDAMALHGAAGRVLAGGELPVGRADLPMIVLVTPKGWTGPKSPAATSSEATRVLGGLLRDVIAANPKNFRLFGPDGRVMEVLSEHLCQGWLEGYLLTGRHGLFTCYEHAAVGDPLPAQPRLHSPAIRAAARATTSRSPAKCATCWATDRTTLLS